ncbi:putative 1-phosphatidylinositol-3-phosphate 5-kinase FAB1C [Magnolia sinica]|uniref:putative 1-phosphatidylinositol-3-phosphate 5-kinase FAB1C n=1 Tax=Magnolia sinica TaxID=86752 RepID=UPI00265AF3CE|nr:putative 1-phosphatidylinositol-3-phosphate 5-kinase FAB1C [Magnolia sinica]
MGIPHRSISGLISTVRSWILRWAGGGDLSGVLPREFWMLDDSCKMCYECEARFTALNRQHHCRSCGRVFCAKCMQGTGAGGDECAMFCKFCFRAICGLDAVVEYDEKMDAFQSDRLARFLESQQGSSPNVRMGSCTPSSVDPLSPMSLRCSASRSDEEDAGDTGKIFLSPSSEYCHDISDVDASCRHDFYNFKSVTMSPLGSPSRMTNSPNRASGSPPQDQVGSSTFQDDALLDQESTGVLRRPGMEGEDLENTDDCTDNLSIFKNQCQEVQPPLDFENNGLIWFPPPPEDEEDDVEDSYFEYDDEDDDVGDTGMQFSSSSFTSDAFPARERSNDGQKEPLRAVVQGHFRALVSQLLKGEGICVEHENISGGWLEIVASLAWRAANFVKPDTSRGGSMDPGDYVKVKCVVSGRPSESTLVKGVVCTKNIKHKRMTSQYKSPKLLLLGGALEYQRVPNQLASIDTLLQQEIDHLKMTVSKIEAHRPNVLLVEKSVSSYAQEYLLAKEISLVLNIKRPLLERISRCTGAHIVPSIDRLSSARSGHCDNFRLERVTESASMDQSNKKITKTLMFFEGCPKRLGCTVLLRGPCREELKKVKHVVQFAVFAAYHLSLETSFLADEGATLPKITSKSPISISERAMDAHSAVPVISDSSMLTPCQKPLDESIVGICSEPDEWESPGKHFDPGTVSAVHPGVVVSSIGRAFSVASSADLVSYGSLSSFSGTQFQDLRGLSVLPADGRADANIAVQESSTEEGKFGSHRQAYPAHEYENACKAGGNGVSSDYFSAADNNQSILVSLSSRCVLKGTVCERSQLFRIKFYGSFDKPLGRFLRDDLFDQTWRCRSCEEPPEAHVRCYTHQQGSLTISVRRLPSLKLSGERDGKIWMWHRCLKCAHKDGVPPASRRVVMSDAAWGLSFGKFLELSFSNHATANRVASCGHSLQKDCLRYYGFGSMVAFFRYSSIDILSVNLPPSMLEFNTQIQQEWVRREAMEVSKKIRFLYTEVFDVLQSIEQQITDLGCEPSPTNDIRDHIKELKHMLKKERDEYDGLLQSATTENWHTGESIVDILELNRLRRCLLIDSYMWDRQLTLLDSCVKTKPPISKVDLCPQENAMFIKPKDWRSESHRNNCGSTLLENPRDLLLSKQQEELTLQPSEAKSNELVKMDSSMKSVEGDVGPEEIDSTFSHVHKQDESHVAGEVLVENTPLERSPSAASVLSDKIDLAWTGMGQPVKAQFPHATDGQEGSSIGQINQMENILHRKVMTPMRVYSFDSALKFHDRNRRGLSPFSFHLSSARSFHASRDFGSFIWDPIPNMLKTRSQTFPRSAQKLNLLFGHTPSFISSISRMLNEGARLLLPQVSHNNIVIAVYDNEPTSVISYALSSKEYEECIADKVDEREGRNENDSSRDDDISNLLGYRAAVSTLSSWQSISSLDSDDIQSRSYGSDEVSTSRGSLFMESKRSPHVRVYFDDESSSPAGKVKFSVTCYFAKQFDALRRKCCSSEVDFIRSLSRCRRWSAQGGKSHVYFAKTLDERFIIKQVTKTELESFEEFAPQYFTYLMDSLNSGSPTCLAKILGIYQVTVKHLKGGKEVKMDLMVMENLFFGRSISRVYDLKGSSRSRYNPDSTGSNKVLLDLNLLETLRTNPIFLGSKAKRSLERAVWNDTSFLASVDVMDYSLLVGVDEERKELVLGIIDFMRQYTWDKHLETWVKASGILGGPKNASPTIISPKQYKKRFRKAMSTYFLTVPDQWSS